jgi:hypothetical protein
MGKNKAGLGWLLYKIVDCARMCFSSVRNQRSARTAFRPRNIPTLQQRGRDLSRHVYNPDSSADLQGLSAYQNIQGAGRADIVDTRVWLG